MGFSRITNNASSTPLLLEATNPSWSHPSRAASENLSHSTDLSDDLFSRKTRTGWRSFGKSMIMVLARQKALHWLSCKPLQQSIWITVIRFLLTCRNRLKKSF